MYKNDNYYLLKILGDADFIIQHMANLPKERFIEDLVLQDSMMFRLIQISESARGLSDTFREQNDQIPWTDIFGLRNRIVHNYGSIDFSVVYDTLTRDIPELRKQIEDL